MTLSGVIVASASAFIDESESEYLQASITGMPLSHLYGVLNFFFIAFLASIVIGLVFAITIFVSIIDLASLQAWMKG